MEGRREEGIRKGPWKAEEDQVLLNHVKKYGPRDWSSIRSKGLLQRTGKSCRLRWVNKLRPNLKNGCKFTLEEERVVIELQAQFGNKWAKIATYLSGRTDNDVKNFWSSRQKRLARILQTSAAAAAAAATPPKPHKIKREVAVYHHEVPAVEAPKFSGSSEGEPSSQAQSYSPPPCNGNPDIIKMMPLPDIVKPELIVFESNPVHHELIATEKTPWIDTRPLIPFLQNPQSQTELEFSTETQELLDRLDPYYGMFGPLDSSELGNEEQLAVVSPFLGPLGSCGSEREKIDIPITPDYVFDDFPEDMFDQIEPLPDSSEKH